MATNSIKDNLTKSEIISELLLSIKGDVKKEYIHLIVEGVDDIRFFKSRVSPHVYIYESFSGKEGVFDILKNFKKEDRILGICDRDYADIPTDLNIFFYDFSCLEIMLISNEDVFKSCSDTFYYGSLNSNELLLKILNELKWLGIFRRLSFQKKFAIKFNGLSITNAFNKSTLSLNISNLITQINSRNDNFCEKNHDILNDIEKQSRNILSKNELLYLSQGHDFLNLFKCFCGENFKPEVFFCSLLCCYQKNHFQSTNLYSSLKKYQSEKNLNNILN